MPSKMQITRRGHAAHRRASRLFDPLLAQVEGALSRPVPEVRELLLELEGARAGPATSAVPPAQDAPPAAVDRPDD